MESDGSGEGLLQLDCSPDMPILPHSLRVRAALFGIISLAVLLLAGYVLIWNELVQRLPSVRGALPSRFLAELGGDAGIDQEIRQEQEAVFDSLRRVGDSVPSFLKPGDTVLCRGAQEDTLAWWLGNASLWWDAAKDSSRGAAPRLAGRHVRDSLRQDIEAFANEVRLSRADLGLAALLLSWDRCMQGGRSPDDERLLRRLVQARRLREGIWPGRWSLMRERHVAAMSDRARSEARCWKALERLAHSWGVPDSGLGSIRRIAFEHGLDSALRSARPRDPVWLPLLREAWRYRDLAQAGDALNTQRFPGKVALETDTVLGLSVNRRLGVLGYEVPRNDSGAMQAKAVSGGLLETFQANRGVRVTGKWNDTTWRELVREDASGFRRICSTLTLLTRTPWHRDSVCVRVNIPEFVLDFLEEGRRVRQHRVVVGRDTVGRFTPQLSSQLRNVVINPQWHVPSKILREEIMAGKGLDAKVLRDQGYEPKYDADGNLTGAYQPSGEDNALGKVKLLFDNRFGVYIHDTPSRYLFARRFRAYSHGCVRLERPLDFAAFLLARDGHPMAEKLDSLVDEEDQKWLKIVHPVPVHFEYRTVSVDSIGRVRFLKDIYALAREKAKREKERLKREKKLAALSAGKGYSPASPRRSSTGTDTTAR